jgi:hypothetical protein
VPFVKRPFSLLLLFLFTGLLAACFPQTGGSAIHQQQKTPLFIPPTQEGPISNEAAYAGESTPSALHAGSTGNSTTGSSQSTPTVQCRDSLSFLKDVTIPDGTSVAPDSTLDKRWEVENNGNCNWAVGYRIRLIAGAELSAQKEQALYPARSGSRAILRMVFKAPLEPGTYRSAWQAFNPQGEPFGDPFFIEIKVEAP